MTRAIIVKAIGGYRTKGGEYTGCMAYVGKNIAENNKINKAEHPITWGGTTHDSTSRSKEYIFEYHMIKWNMFNF